MHRICLVKLLHKNIGDSEASELDLLHDFTEQIVDSFGLEQDESFVKEAVEGLLREGVGVVCDSELPGVDRQCPADEQVLVRHMRQFYPFQEDSF